MHHKYAQQVHPSHQRIRIRRLGVGFGCARGAPKDPFDTHGTKHGMAFTHTLMSPSIEKK